MASSSNPSSSYSIGIDIGTTSVKVSVLKDGLLLEESESHEAQNADGVQDVAKLMRVTLDLIALTTKDFARQGLKLAGVGVCSQMHGVCTWNADEVKREGVNASFSGLYTWEYTGVPADHLSSLRFENHVVEPGFGCGTLSYLDEKGEIDNKHDRAGTIGDLLVAVLARSTLKGHVMSDQMAASFGLCEGRRWIGSAAFSGHWQSLLPSIVPPFTVVGFTDLELHEEARAPIWVAQGDLQATVYPHITAGTNRVVLNIGTSSQIVYGRHTKNKEYEAYESTNLNKGPFSLRPFYEDEKVVCLASMNGGNMVMAHLKKTLDAELSSEELTDLMKAADNYADAHKYDTTPQMVSEGKLHKERGDLNFSELKVRPFLANDTTEYPKEVEVAAVCTQVIRNLFHLASLDSNLHREIVLVGSANSPRYRIPIEKQIESFNRLNKNGSSLVVIEPKQNDVKYTSASAGVALFAHQSAASAPHQPANQPAV